jgi:hypothetical protein
MRIMLLAAAAALSLGVGLAYAKNEGIAPLPTPGAHHELDAETKVIITPDSVDRAPAQKAPAIVPAPNERREDTHLILLY